MKSSSTLLIILALITLLSNSSSAEYSSLEAFWVPINNTNDPHVIEIAKFAIDANKRMNNVNVIFKQVLRGQTNGTNYVLLMNVNDPKWETDEFCETHVYESPAKQLQLIAFQSRPNEDKWWEPIRDINNPHVIEVVKFAIDDFNRKAEPSVPHLVLMQMLDGQKKVDNRGMNYILRFHASDVNDYFEGNFQTQVLEDDAEQKQIIYFTIAPP